jgi:glycerol kinase
MNTGETPLRNDKGLVTSLAWRMNGAAHYVLEGNINYTGAVMRWVHEDLKLLGSVRESSALAQVANTEDTSYLIPAFTGLGTPYWKSDAKALLCGMTRHTGRAEIVRAALDSIAYQIMDVLELMVQKVNIEEIRADGGPASNEYLMQFQSDICNIPVLVAQQEELSALGAGFAAGIALGLYDDEVFRGVTRKTYLPHMDSETRRNKIQGWRDALRLALGKD